MATAFDVTGAMYPGESKEPDIAPMDGVSLMPAFRGGMHKRGKPLFFQFGGGSSMREGKWKLVRSNGKAEWELYDMSQSRTEMDNQAAEQPERVKRMDAEWNKWWRDCTGTQYKVPRKQSKK